MDFRSQVEPEEKAASTTTSNFQNPGQPPDSEHCPAKAAKRNAGRAGAQVSVKERGWRQKHRREKAKARTLRGKRNRERELARAGEGASGI